MEEKFSQKLIKFKEENGLLQSEMADILGISERMYIYYEKGKYDGSSSRITKYLRKLAEYLQKKKEINYFGTTFSDNVNSLKKENELQNKLINQMENEIHYLRDKMKNCEQFKGIVFDAILRGLSMHELEELIKKITLL